MKPLFPVPTPEELLLQKEAMSELVAAMRAIGRVKVMQVGLGWCGDWGVSERGLWEKLAIRVRYGFDTGSECPDVWKKFRFGDSYLKSAQDCMRSWYKKNHNIENFSQLGWRE